MLKKSVNILTRILKHLINRSFTTGIVPNDAKIAKIIPIFKTGCKDLVTNYRPISVLPVLSKVIEKVMNGRLTDFIEKNAVLFY